MKWGCSPLPCAAAANTDSTSSTMSDGMSIEPMPTRQRYDRKRCFSCSRRVMSESTLSLGPTTVVLTDQSNSERIGEVSARTFTHPLRFPFVRRAPRMGGLFRWVRPLPRFRGLRRTSPLAARCDAECLRGSDSSSCDVKRVATQERKPEQNGQGCSAVYTAGQAISDDPRSAVWPTAWCRLMMRTGGQRRGSDLRWRFS